MADLQSRFQQSFIEWPDADWCRCWLYSRSTKGYGQIRVDGRLRQAHRVAWELAVGPIPQEMCVCHTCDVPSCVNPRHLFLGSNSDNVADKMKKGRWGGNTAGANQNSYKISCLRGHPLDADNTYGRPDGKRACRECQRARSRTYYLNHHNQKRT